MMRKDFMDEQELKKILEDAETPLEDKIKLLIGLHETANRGIVQKRDELLGQEKKLKEKIAELEGKVTEAEGKQKELSEELAKNSKEEHKKYYDTQLAEAASKYDAKLKVISEERDKLLKSHYTRLQNDVIEEATKEIQFDEGLKPGFIARVLSLSAYEAKEIDGKTEFVNSANETLQQGIHKFTLTSEGKSYIKNPNKGGGAPGSTGTKPTVTNPWAKETLNLTQQMTITRDDPALAKSLMEAAGVKT